VEDHKCCEVVISCVREKIIHQWFIKMSWYV
jgi:hypothetical protein